MKKPYFLLILAFLTFGLSGCGGGSSVTPEVEAAMSDAANFEKTVYFALSSGSFDGLRNRIVLTFPEVETLIAGGGSARDAMLESFTGNPSISDDEKLAIFAYALEQMGDSGSLAGLRSFLGNNVTGDLYLTPQFVTHAIKVLAGESTLGDLFYTPADMRASTVSADLSKSAFADTATRLSCARQFELTDGSGNVMTYVDSNGVTQQAVITGYVFTTSNLSDEETTRLQQEVADGGGTYVTDDPEFRGSPSSQFNCAGYAFRGLNSDSKWRLDPAKTFDVFTRTGLLVEVNESEAHVGDIVFYFQSSGATLPAHVAEVERIESGVLSNTIIVRNADNNTGLWEAPIDASYFTGSWLPGSADPRYPVRKVYRWASGAEPAVIKDPDATSTDYCDSSSTGFSASIDITGYSVSFDPTSVVGANNGEYTGGVHLTDVVGILATQGSGSSESLVSILFDRRQIFGGGTYSFNTANGVFDSYSGAATLTFASPAIANEDGSPVAFQSLSGSTTLTSWGTSLGDQLIGTYLANVSGDRTYLDAWGNPTSETLTGTVSGSYNVEITEGN